MIFANLRPIKTDYILSNSEISEQHFVCVLLL